MNRNEVQTATENVHEDQMAKTEVTNAVMDHVETILKFYNFEVGQILFDLRQIDSMIENHSNVLHDYDQKPVISFTDFIRDLQDIKFVKTVQLVEAQKKYNKTFDLLIAMKNSEMEVTSC